MSNYESLFQNDRYRWRETYFVLFDASRRPTLERLQHRLSRLTGRFTLTNLSADPSGRFQRLTVLAPDDFAALDISYLEGEEVLEQADRLVDEMQTTDCRPEDRVRLDRLRRCDGRFDVLHFEQIVSFDDESDEVLDPSALLVVLQALAEETGGLAVDPQASTFL
jgi:hypothetical protein